MTPQAGKIKKERVDVFMGTSFNDAVRYAVPPTLDQS